MRSRRVATALVVLTTGLVASAAMRRFVGRRRSVIPAVAAPAAASAPVPVVPAAVDKEAVVLPFARRAEVAPAAKPGPARCGETGGVTKAGAPCGALALAGGRCRHHRLAA